MGRAGAAETRPCRRHVRRGPPALAARHPDAEHVLAFDRGMTAAPAFAEIGIVGAGAYGAALAIAAARAGRSVTLWARDPASVETMTHKRETPRLPGIPLPQSLRLTAALPDLAVCDALIVAVPTQ